MSIEVKICGIRDEAVLKAAVESGAKFVGFVFYPPSPRAVTVDEAAQLVKLVPAMVTPVGLFVDPTDEDILLVLQKVPLRMIQLHGKETPERVAQIKKQTGIPVMKAIAVRDADDIARAASYEDVADWMLFDAKPCDSVKALPGGNAIAFDWNLMAGRNFKKPWMLAGGLNAGNLAEAVRITGAKCVDVSSGVEDMPGKKNPEKIRELIALAERL